MRHVIRWTSFLIVLSGLAAWIAFVMIPNIPVAPIPIGGITGFVIMGGFLVMGVVRRWTMKNPRNFFGDSASFQDDMRAIKNFFVN